MYILNRKNLISPTLTLLTVAMLSACGGNSGDNTNTPTDPTVNQGEVTADTDRVIQSAVDSVSGNIGTNMNSLESTTEGSSAVDGLLSDDDDNLNPSADQITSSQPFADDEPLGFDKMARDVVLPTLEGGNATRTRDGNTITIDPDEQYVCQQWSRDELDFIDPSDVQNCAELISDLTVRIDATSDDTGKLTYLFANSNLLVIDYAPTAGGFEFVLPTIKAVIQRDSEITGSDLMVPDVVLGAIKLSTVVTNNTPGSESGSMSFAVTEPVRIKSDADNYDLQLGNSTRLTVESNAATEDAKVSLNLDSIVLSMDDFVGTDPNALSTVNIPNFSITAELQESGDKLLLTDTGFGTQAMSLSVSDRIIMTLAMAKTSMLFSDEPILSILQNFDFDLNISDLSELTGGDYPVNSTAALALSTIGGTVLQEQDNDSIRVISGGPFNVAYSLIDGDTNPQGTSSFAQGECFEASEDELGLVLASCE